MKKTALTIIMFLISVLPIYAATPILGTNVATVERMYQFVKSKNSSFDREIAEQFIAVSQVYGMRGDIAMCQSIIETGWFKYTGGTAVTPEDHNYCGLGVTTLGQKGCQFETVREGVTAQIQHLYAYCCTKALPAGETLVDPRFNYVSRGTAPNWENLGSGKWATAAGYGTSIIEMYNEMMAFNYSEPSSLKASETAISLSATQGATAPSKTITITGVNLSSAISYSSSSSAFTVSTSGWNSLTGGNLIIKLNTSLSAGTYSGVITVKSGSYSLTINCTGVISQPIVSSLTVNPTSISLKGEVGSTDIIYRDVKVVGTNLSSDITIASNTSAVTVTKLSGWNDLTGGTLRLTLNTNYTYGAGTYDSYVAVQSASSRAQINTTITLTEPIISKNPTIEVSPSNASMRAIVGESTTTSINVTGTDLSGNISASLSGNSAFSINKTSIGSTGGTITVTYKPIVAGTHSATLSLTSTGATTKTVTLSGTATAAEPLGLSLIWRNTTSIPGSTSGGDYRFAGVSNGHLLVVDKANNKIIEFTQSGYSTYYDCASAISTHWNATTMGPAIGCDDAGNILVHTGWSGAASGSNFMIISADLKNTYKLNLSTIEGYTVTRLDQIGRIRGNMLSSEGAYAFICSYNGSTVLILNIKNGSIDTDYTQISNDTGLTVGASSTPQPAFETTSEIDALMDENGDLSNAFILRQRGNANDIYYWNDDNSAMKAKYTFTNTTPEGYSPIGATSEGFDWFHLGDKSYFIIPLSSDGTTNGRSSAFGIYDEDGNLVGYNVTAAKTGIGQGMGSIIAVPRDEHAVNIYHFVAGTVAEKYLFRISGNATGTEKIENSIIEEDINAPICFYNLQGTKVANPSKGIYIKVQGNKTEKIYFK